MFKVQLYEMIACPLNPQGILFVHEPIRTIEELAPIAKNNTKWKTRKPSTASSDAMCTNSYTEKKLQHQFTNTNISSEYTTQSHGDSFARSNTDVHYFRTKIKSGTNQLPDTQRRFWKVGIRQQF